MRNAAIHFNTRRSKVEQGTDKREKNHSNVAFYSQGTNENIKHLPQLAKHHNCLFSFDKSE
jgi:hypothetical protein